MVLFVCCKANPELLNTMRWCDPWTLRNGVYDSHRNPIKHMSSRGVVVDRIPTTFIRNHHSFSPRSTLKLESLHSDWPQPTLATFLCTRHDEQLTSVNATSKHASVKLCITLSSFLGNYSSPCEMHSELQTNLTKVMKSRKLRASASNVADRGDLSSLAQSLAILFLSPASSSRQPI